VNGQRHSIAKPAVQTKPTKLLLSLEDAARAMGIGINSLKGLIADGTVFSIPVGDTGKHRRVPVAEIEKWRTGRYDHGTSGASQGQ
jgi:hypothetical protein